MRLGMLRHGAYAAIRYAPIRHRLAQAEAPRQTRTIPTEEPTDEQGAPDEPEKHRENR